MLDSNNFPQVVIVVFEWQLRVQQGVVSPHLATANEGGENGFIFPDFKWSFNILYDNNLLCGVSNFQDFYFHLIGTSI